VRSSGSAYRAKDLDTQTLKQAHVVELDTDVEGRLSAKGQKDTIGPLLLNDVCDVFGGEWKEVDDRSVAVLDRCNIGVEKNGLDTGL
jgi:hypothetical protein